MSETKELFQNWWKRTSAEDFNYEDDYVVGMARTAAEHAFAAGWRAALRKKRLAETR